MVCRCLTDSSWISPRMNPGGYGFTDEFNKRVYHFLEFAQNNSRESNNPEHIIICPCNTSRNQLFQFIPDGECHLSETIFF